MRFDVFDVDDERNIQDLSKQDLCGRSKALALGTVVSAHAGRTVVVRTVRAPKMRDRKGGKNEREEGSFRNKNAVHIKNERRICMLILCPPCAHGRRWPRAAPPPR